MCALAAAAVIVVIFAAAAQVVAIAAAAEQQDQDDDPPATVTAPRITTHNRYLQERFCYGLRRTFHVIPQTRKGAARFFGGEPHAHDQERRGGRFAAGEELRRKRPEAIVKLHKGANCQLSILLIMHKR